MSTPAAWISDESLNALKFGGNGSRGTVPVHAERSSVSKHPLYLAAALAQPEPVAGLTWAQGDRIMQLVHKLNTAAVCLKPTTEWVEAIDQLIHEYEQPAPAISLPPAAEKQDERARFEAWAKDRKMALYRDKGCEYAHPATRDSWVGWQAALAQSPAQDHRNGLPHSANMMDKDGVGGVA